MSLSDREIPMSRLARIARLAALACVVGLTAACTVRPVYMPVANSPMVSADLSAIAVDGVTDRVPQQVRNNLLFGFTGGKVPPPARYTMTLTVTTEEARLGFEKDETAPAYQITVTARYQLTEISSGRILLRSLDRGVATYNRSNQDFANIRARIDAEDRAAVAVAEQIELKLATTLASQKAH
jgi:LPS-assembly lipoprotein